MIRRRPRSNATLSAAEQQVLAWARLGGGVWSASILADQSVCRVQEWIEAGQANPGGPHGQFAAEMKKLEATNGSGAVKQCCGVQLGKGGPGYGQPPVNGSSNGHANGSNGQAQPRLLSFEEL